MARLMLNVSFSSSCAGGADDDIIPDRHQDRAPRSVHLVYIEPLDV